MILSCVYYSFVSLFYILCFAYVVQILSDMSGLMSAPNVTMLTVEGLEQSGRRNVFLSIKEYLLEHYKVLEMPLTVNDDKLSTWSSMFEFHRHEGAHFYDYLLAVYGNRARKFLEAWRKAEEGTVILSFFILFHSYVPEHTLQFLF